MQIAQVLADYSLGEADLLRRAMGKKIPEEMAKQKDRFLEGARKKGIDPKKAEKIFDLMAKFAEYGFNKSHSAAYALVAYQTAYLKAHHPVAFMAALLTNDRANTDKVVKDIAECRDMGIRVLPPDVNESDLHFTVVGDAIRFGLAAVKNVGEAAIENVLAVRRKDGPFRGLRDFCRRVDLQKVNRKVIESLIRCGAFDSLGGTRAQYLAYLDRCMEEASALQKDRARGQTNLFEALAAAAPESGASAVEDELPDVPPLGAAEDLRAEKEVLGMYLSGHPLAEWEDLLRSATDTPIGELGEQADKAQVTVGGMVAARRVIRTKNGSRMAFFTLEDLTGAVEVVAFSEVFARAEDLIQAEDVPLVVRGTLEKNEETAKVLADEVLPLEEAPERLTREVHIQVNAAFHGRGDLEALKRILSSPEMRGATPTLLRIVVPEKAEAVVRLPEAYSVRASGDLKARVRDLMGADVVQFR